MVGHCHSQQFRLGVGSGGAIGAQVVEQASETAADLEHSPRLDVFSSCRDWAPLALPSRPPARVCRWHKVSFYP